MPCNLDLIYSLLRRQCLRFKCDLGVKYTSLWFKREDSTLVCEMLLYFFEI